MIYLDNAATSFPKPRCVLQTVRTFLSKDCGNPGRGAHRLAMAASEAIYACREELASFFACPTPENVSFSLNTTTSLNTVIKGFLKDGDHVLISDLEHNAVYRPIYRMHREGKITYDVFPSFALERKRSDAQIVEAICRRITPRTRMLICTHMSNLCPVCLPLEAIGKVCRKRGIFFLVDGAQSAGHLPINMEKMQIDALCVPAHKGLWGLQGAGALLLGRNVRLDPLYEGGSGFHSLDGEMPTDSPERYEAGTLSSPAIVGLCEGIREIRRIGPAVIREKEERIAERIKERLCEIPGIRIAVPWQRGPLVLFHGEGISSDQLSAGLDCRGICTRPGFHCAALGHAALHTPPDGAVRASVGYFNRLSDADALADAVAEIMKEQSRSRLK